MESSSSLVSQEKLAAEAFARIAPELAALSADELTQVNLDLQQATGTILGVLPEVVALRAQIVKELPGFDIAQFDKLEDYTLALRFAHAAYQTATLPPDDLAELSTEAVALRARLVADASALSLHGLLDGRKLESLRGANGIKNVAQDLQMLSQIMQDAWPQIQGKSATVAEDLQTASRIGTRITRVVGTRQQAPAQLTDATDQRLRVFTLTLRAYEEARSAVAYLRRREGDAESIAPTLYTGRPRHRSTDKPTPDVPTTGVATDKPKPEPAPVPTGATTVDPAGSSASKAAERSPAKVAPPNGDPGSHGPFVS